MGKPIGEALREEADRLLHADFRDDAKAVFMQFFNSRPRIDSGEWTIYCQAQIDVLQEYHSGKAGVPLRRIEIDIIDGTYGLRKP